MRTQVSPGRAFVDGALTVAQAPLVLVTVAAVMVVLTIPFAVTLGAGLDVALASQPPVALSETEIDADWWREFRAHARGLAATFTPAVLGVAAPLDSISGLLDGRRPQPALLMPLGASIAAWAFLWGGILARFYARRAIGITAFVAAGLALMGRFAAIALAALAVIALLYLTMHPRRFGPAFVVPAVMVALVADYARAALVTGRVSTVREALGSGVSFIRHHLLAVLIVFVLTITSFIAITVAYAAIELSGAIDVMSWRAIALGQLYILARLAIRLIGAGSALQLFASHTTPQ